MAGATSPVDGIRHVNRLLYQDACLGRYVVAFYGALDGSGQLDYVNAGLGEPLWWQAESHAVVPLGCDALHLGVAEEIEVRPRRLRLERGDVVLLWSDGLVEQPSREGRPFGTERLVALLDHHAALDVAGLAAAIWEEVQLWLRGQQPSDDLLLVVLKYDPA